MATDREKVRAYFAALPPASRRVMKEMRAIIRSAAPDAVEGFSYRIPCFRLDDRPLVWYAAFKAHVGMYPRTVRFPLDEPLPAARIRKIVKARIAAVRGK